ncbi:hypothetical protein IWQ60_004058 [Tieghemiomyces parasiticus]|uniref:EF-hand domain-containing protein n=1 Tax=Tieghemiomyces parasiticus TaxID=78921 RepID=A0A9W8AGU3_9FUNG|nr:hypothetical protein IWQ60_004058 [Tieghemiomyces parasiticus]
MSSGPSHRTPPASPAQKLHENQLQNAFAAFDTAGDGWIPATKLRHVLTALNLPNDRAAVTELQAELDRHRTGRIEYPMYLRVLRSCLAARNPADELRSLFAMFDVTGAGRISVRDLERVASELDEAIPAAELQEMVDMADRDGDGLVDLDDFTLVMRKVGLL